MILCSAVVGQKLANLDCRLLLRSYTAVQQFVTTTMLMLMMVSMMALLMMMVMMAMMLMTSDNDC